MLKNFLFFKLVYFQIMDETSFDELTNMEECANLTFSPGESSQLRQICKELLNATVSENEGDEVGSIAETASLFAGNECEPSTSFGALKKNKKSDRKMRKHNEPTAKGKRPRQTGQIECLLCGRKVINMRQHLSKNHTITVQHRKFLLSYYATKICSSSVFQCNTCLTRFTGKKKHKKKCKQHDIVQVDRNSVNNFPVKLKLEASMYLNQAANHPDLIQHYDDNRFEAGDPALTRFQKTFLNEVLLGTAFFRKPLDLKKCLKEIQKKRNYTFQTVRKLLFELSRFIDFCDSYKQKELRFNSNLMKGEVKTLLKKTAKEAAKEINIRAQKRFSQVPSLYEVSHVRQLVKEALGQSEYDTFAYLEYLAFLIFIIHSESNCRIGALLNLSIEEYETMQEKKVLTTFDHKTGAKFPNFIRVSAENRVLVDKLHLYFGQENSGKVPALAFPSPTNKKFTCQAKYLKEALKKYFRIDDKNYNPDNIRKAWDSFFVKSNFVEGHNAMLYQMNTGHSKTTRDKFYVKPATDDEIVNFLDIQLSIIEDPEKCYVSPDDPPDVPKLQEQDQNEEQQADIFGESDHGERWEEEKQERTTLTPQEGSFINEANEADNVQVSDEESALPENNNDYEPINKDTWTAKQLQEANTRGREALKWEAIRLKLFTFRGPPDPLQGSLESIFSKIVKRKQYMGRNKIRELCKQINLNMRDQELVVEKASKKLSNVMKNIKY